MTLLLATSILDLILPLVGSVISSDIAARDTYGYHNDMLRDIKDDATRYTTLLYGLHMYWYDNKVYRYQSGM